MVRSSGTSWATYGHRVSRRAPPSRRPDFSDRTGAHHSVSQAPHRAPRRPHHPGHRRSRSRPTSLDRIRSRRSPPAGEIVPGEVIVQWRDAAQGTRRHRARGASQSSRALAAAPDAAAVEVVSTEGRRSPTSSPSCSADPAVEHAEPNYVMHLAVDEVDRRGRGQRPEDRTAVLARPHARPRRVVPLDRCGTGSSPCSTPASSPPIRISPAALVAGHDFVNNDGDARRRQRPRHLGCGDHRRQRERWIRHRRHQLARPDHAGEDHERQRHRRHLRPDLRHRLGRRSRRDDHQHERRRLPVLDVRRTTPSAMRWNQGVVLVGAAGNNATEGPFYPASYPEVISVSATQVDDEFTNWSNYGADVDVSAPGRIGPHHELRGLQAARARPDAATIATRTSAAPASPPRTWPESWRSSGRASRP